MNVAQVKILRNSFIGGVAYSVGDVVDISGTDLGYFTGDAKIAELLEVEASNNIQQNDNPPQ